MSSRRTTLYSENRVRSLAGQSRAWRVLAMASCLVALAQSSAHAVGPYYWDTTTTTTWQTGSAWSTSATTGGTTGVVPSSTDTVTFNQSSVSGTEIVQLAAPTTIASITFTNTGSTKLESSSSTTQNLTLGTNSLTVASGAGAVTLGDATNGMSITLSANDAWYNNSANTLTVLGPVYLATTSGTGGILTIGTGSITNTGNVTISGAISNFNGSGGTAGALVVKTGTTTAPVVTLSGNNTFTGGVTLNDGTLALGNANALGTGTLTITASAGNTTAVEAVGGALSIANRVNVTTTTASVIGSNDLTFTGQFGNFAISSVLTVNNSGLTTFSGGYDLTDGASARSDQITGSGNVLFNSAITDAGPAGGSNLAYNGTGTLTFTSINTMRGNLTINGGALVLNGGSLVGSTVTIGGSTTNASMTVDGNYSLQSSTVGKLVISGGNGTTTGQGTLNMVDGTTNTLTLSNNTSGANTFSIGGTAGNSSILDMEVGATSDQIAMGSATKIVIGAGGATVNITGLGNLSGTAQTLISSGTGTGTSSSTYSVFSLGSTSGNFSGYTVGLGTASLTALTLTESKNTVGSTAYWEGAASAVTAQGGSTAWNSFVNGNTNTSNFSTDSAGATNANFMIGANTDVTFNASSVSTGPSTTLGQNFTIDSLTLNTNGVTIASGAGTNTLTINTSTNGAANGINVTATSGSSETISAPVALGNSQSWSVNSGDTLNVSGPISGGSNALTLTGGGTLALSGTNSYTGNTTVANGKLHLTGSLASGAVNVGNNTATTAILSGTGTATGNVTTTTTGSNVAYLAPGLNTTGTRNDFGSVGTLHVGGNLALGTGTNLDFDLSSSGLSGNDQIAVTGAVTVGTALTFNFNELTGSLDTTNKYQLITFGGTAPSLSGVGFTTNLTGAGSYTAVYSIDGGGQAIDVAFSVPTITPAAAFFNGNGADLSTFANFNTDVSSGTAVTSALGSTTNVSFNANQNTTVSTATLNAGLDINSLTFGTGSGIHSGMTINGTGTISIEATTAGGHGIGDGITVNTGGGNNAINTAVTLNNDQTWTVTDSTSTLTLGGAVSGSHMLSTAGNGVVKLANATGNTYSGGTSVGGASTLYITNTSNSATGTGSLTVARGANLAGTGIINATSGAINLGGTGSSGVAKVFVGQAPGGDTNTTGNMTLEAASGLSIANTTLAFNLNTASAGSGNELAVGNTAVSFGTGVTLQLNLQGGQVIQANTPYVLFAGTGTGTGLNGSIYSGLGNGGLDANGHIIITGLTLSIPGYGNSYLFLNQTGGVDDIEVEVVPEPSTYALIIGGLAVLVFWQRRKSKQS